jgi:signal transduction histidine kinase
MGRNVLTGLNQNRLRLILILILVLFFIALAIPTGILVKQAYSQLKWEAFHNQRVQAEELVARIDNRYVELLDKESARSFTDYSFLNVAGDPAANLLQRSPLTRFPVQSAIPGVIGYFQIDTQGHFTTPLLPDSEGAAFAYGIEADEFRQRQQVHNQLYQLLSENHLLQLAKSNRPARVVDKAKKDERDNGAEVRGALSIASPVVPEEIAQSQPTLNEEVPAQAAFDKLQAQEISRYSAQKKAAKSLGRVEDLKLERRYRQKLDDQKKQQPPQSSKWKKKSAKRILRKEKSALPNQGLTNEILQAKIYSADKDSPISIFESEIDEFEFSMLDSGHFVLFRKVWRDGRRYIQGMLIEPATLINKVVAEAFYATSVSNSSNLAVAYQGNVLSVFDVKTNRGYISSTDELQGTLLLQDRLSAMLSGIELIFSINQLGAGPGARVINWLAVILLVVFMGGFWLMYRLGCKQISLGQQQQDFVSAVSHELKTPLTSIRMYGEILREGWADEEKRKTYYEYIYDESERLTRLINNVLQLARMTRNGIKVELKVYGVSELIDTLRSKVQSQVEHAGFKLSIVCDEDCTNKQIQVDADYFSQIMINLVDNAIKFSMKSDKHQIDISCKAMRDGTIQFAVRDYGPGIAKDQMRKIFKLFYRTESELTRETVGTGIGLALVSQLTLAMHGRTDVVNEQPGVEFRLIFPTIIN